MRLLLGLQAGPEGIGPALPGDRHEMTTGRTGTVASRIGAALAHHLPEQRLFLKSDSATRFVRLRPATQAIALGGAVLALGWMIIATAILLMDQIGAGDARAEASRQQAGFESRLEAMAAERDRRAAEAAAAQDRFAVALGQISAMQSALLASEERRRELETGIGVIQSTLRRAMGEREEARRLAGEMSAAMAAAPDPLPEGVASAEDMVATLRFVTAALGQTASERDGLAGSAEAARAEAADVAYEMRLLEERHDEIFGQLEEAVAVSMEPLDKMFAAAGMDPDDLIDKVRRGYSGQGGPMMPLLPPVTDDSGGAGAARDAARANAILEGLDRMNLYRIAVEKAPFAMPLKSSFRYTSGFGRRWGRMHEGTDLAGAHGSPILATADGTVTHAGWKAGYGNLVTIRHEFGLETRYGHLSKVRASVGQKVSRGDRIGDMGNTGRSTGTHLHYEVRVNGKAINPMTYIKAASNVF